MTITSVAPVISATGIAAPAFSDVLAYCVAQMQSIFGSDIYLGNDSQDGQLVGIWAKAINDCNSNSVGIYNSFSPATGQGAALSSNVKINGIARDVATFSTVDLVIVGPNGTTISNGIAQDALGQQWNLPASVTILTGNTITVTATAQVLGAINAAANTVTKIATPTLGWQTVNNTSAAAAGAPIETDSQLRQRQAVSTALPSQSILDGIGGAIAQLTGVTQFAAYENPTGSTDGNGIPAKSICMVVQGGPAIGIATQIALKKSPGCGTYGGTSESVTGAYGDTITINFQRPVTQAITAAVSLTALAGYSSAVGVAIQNAVSAYVNAVAIGGGDSAAVEWDSAITAAKTCLVNGQPVAGTFKISAFTLSGPGGAGAPDVPLTFDQISTMAPSDVVLTVT